MNPIIIVIIFSKLLSKLVRNLVHSIMTNKEKLIRLKVESRDNHGNYKTVQYILESGKFKIITDFRNE